MSSLMHLVYFCYLRRSEEISISILGEQYKQYKQYTKIANVHLRNIHVLTSSALRVLMLPGLELWGCYFTLAKSMCSRPTKSNLWNTFNLDKLRGLFARWSLVRLSSWSPFFKRVPRDVYPLALMDL